MLKPPRTPFWDARTQSERDLMCSGVVMGRGTPPILIQKHPITEKPMKTLYVILTATVFGGLAIALAVPRMTPDRGVVPTEDSPSCHAEKAENAGVARATAEANQSCHQATATPKQTGSCCSR